jgi:hypothetical protein
MRMLTSHRHDSRPTQLPALSLLLAGTAFAQAGPAVAVANAFINWADANQKAPFQVTLIMLRPGSKPMHGQASSVQVLTNLSGVPTAISAPMDLERSQWNRCAAGLHTTFMTMSVRA